MSGTRLTVSANKNMNMDSVNKWLMLAANLGVIAGIFFLALEISQNNELMEAEASFRLKENRAASSKLIVESPEYAALFYKFRSGETLSAMEEFRIRAYINQMFINWQWEFNEYKAGRLEADLFPGSQYRSALSNLPFAAQEWERYKSVIPDDQAFLEFMQTEIFGPE